MSETEIVRRAEMGGVSETEIVRRETLGEREQDRREIGSERASQKLLLGNFASKRYNKYG